MHMMMYFIANAIVAFTVGHVVVVAFVGILHIIVSMSHPYESKLPRPSSAHRRRPGHPGLPHPYYYLIRFSSSSRYIDLAIAIALVLVAPLIATWMSIQTCA